MYPSNTFRYLYLPWLSGIIVLLAMLFQQSVSGELAMTSTPGTEVIKEATLKEKSPESVVISTAPYLPGCLQSNEQAKVSCSNEQLMEYIYDHTAYPAGAPIHRTAGIVVADFIISSSGTIRDIRLIREPNREQGKDVVRILGEMEANGIRWEPATMNGRPTSRRMAVTVRYNMVWAGAKPGS